MSSALPVFVYVPVGVAHGQLNGSVYLGEMVRETGQLTS
jgi:hypothetical protein